MTAFHPACCAPFDYTWPLPHALDAVRLVSCRFDPARLDAADFQRCAVPTPASIQRSVAKRQAEYLAGRLCAREAMAPLIGARRVPPIGEDRAPVWPGRICGSISHGAGIAAAVVADRRQWRGLGLDIEELLPDERAARLAEEILVPAELERLAVLPAERRAEYVTLVFSLKESLFKALYPLVLKRFYFEAAEVLGHGHEGRVGLRLLTDLNDDWRNGDELQGQFRVAGDRLLSLVAIAA
ncbi:4'-phosphopantetheinyl transferase superfamily protein [Pseudomonas sp. RIT-PI-AD]|uniref:4'-phosphopantetheinyl transferase family protein n=1 Tax=Pseudomonas sp. RIT-PI-AD TaxID=3035294 RepID=UPI0021DB6569|nr:4'-phosphopantetheinyl transferase superfamily protein [Pseudomonas sp. RIT-PI-AD]